jgi:hypothetical protein
MNCYNHPDRIGIAVCVNCGAAICDNCAKKTDANKNVCSELCAVASKATDSAIAMMASRVKRSSKANAWLLWVLGAVFGLCGVVFLSSDLFFAVYLLAACVVFVGGGFWFDNIAKKS